MGSSPSEWVFTFVWLLLRVTASEVQPLYRFKRLLIQSHSDS